jgi:hypothetical protein
MLSITYILFGAEKYRIWEIGLQNIPFVVLFVYASSTTGMRKFCSSELLESKLRHWPPGMSKLPLMPPFFLRQPFPGRHRQ